MKLKRMLQIILFASTLLAPAPLLAEDLIYATKNLSLIHI